MNAVMFDLDGTLLDTLADIAAACNEVLARHDYPQHPVEAYRRMVGNGFATMLKRALPDWLVPDAAYIEQLTEEARGIYAQAMTRETRPYAGIPQALAALSANGFLLSVLSNKPEQLTKELVAYYFPEISFAAVRGGRAGFPLKPDPAVAFDMLSEMGIAPENCVYAGDSDVDMQTAQNAGMSSLGAGWGFRGASELERSGASLVIASPSQLPLAAASLLERR